MPTKKKFKHKSDFKRTIAIELFEQWRKLVRSKDSEAIAKLLNCSKPTVDKALIYGFVHRQSLVDGITKYFADRLMLEKEEALKLKELNSK